MESIIYSIQKKLPALTKSEKRLAKFVLTDPQKVTTMTTSELATAAAVSPATVARFGQTICGKGGFPTLKIRLSSEKEFTQPIYGEIEPNDSTQDLKNKLTFRINQTLGQTNQLLANQDLEQAAQLIKHTPAVFVYGLGASNIAAEDLQQKLLRVGKLVIQSLDTHLMAAALTAQKDQAVLILISNSGEKSDALHLAALAKSLNMPVIVLTHARDSRLANLATIILQHDDSTESRTLRSAATTSLIAQLYVVDLLYYAFLERHFNKNVSQLSESHQVITDFFK